MTANGPEHDRLHESAGLYVLGALEPTERAEFERHLQSCDECTAEVRSLAAVAAVLPQAVPLIDPSSGLRSRVLGVTGRSTTAHHNVVALPARPARTRSWVSTAGWLSAAALLLLSLGLGSYSMSLQREISGLRTQVGALNARLNESEQRVTVATRLVALADQRMAVLTAPDLKQVDLQGQQPVAPRASGRAFYSRSRGLVFTASDLPPLRAGRTYQLWVVTAQSPVSAGLLEIDSAGRVTQAFNTPPDIANPVAIAVTEEPAGGAPAPTGDKYLVGLTH
jgi:anti-sigma-K factor RskA